MVSKMDTTTCPDVTYPTIDSGRLNSSSSAERVKELKESVWSVVRQENEREDHGKLYRTVVRPALMYGAETCVFKKAQKRNWKSQK